MSALFDQIIQDKTLLRSLDEKQLSQFCGEVRDFLIEHVSKTGGHLASNLCTVELITALHRVFDTPQDKFLFDVGHQAYTHKILTGRADGFERLRQPGGLSGFPNPFESEHDTFIAGHGNTAISAAVGVAQAKKIKGEQGTVVAVVGDGAFTGGMVYEGINNVEKLDNLIVILNDNEMSISKNVGAVSRYFTHLRTSPEYHMAKQRTELVLDRIPLLGAPVKSLMVSGKAVLRRAIYRSTFFEEMGFQYIGPLDGHDLQQLCAVLAGAKEYGRPLFIHAVTKKGKGFAPAEQNPGDWHGVSAFNATEVPSQEVPDPDKRLADSFSEEFGIAITRIAEENPAVCGITAAMKYATGLWHFKKRFPERVFDVGMAEQHAVTFAAGLASQKLRPVVAIYSTFLQRGFDQIIHDVHLQNLPVVFAIDRAGLVPGDGETHQGIYDVAFFSQFDDIPLYAPINYAEQSHWLSKAMEGDTAAAIRWQKGAEYPELSALGCDGSMFRRVHHAEGAQAAIVTYGALTLEALKAAEACGEPVDVYQIVRLAPLPEGLCEALLLYDKLLLAEDSIENGSVGTHLAKALLGAGYKGVYRHIGLPTTGIDHASVSQLRAQYGLDAAHLAQLVKDMK